MGLNDDAWERLFERYRICEHVQQDGSFLISAAQIRQYREPRLMTKFDHIVNLPAVFARNGLAILPVSRGDYIISAFDAYHTFEEPSDSRVRVRLPARLQSLASQYLTSEAIALNCAEACGVLSDFLRDEDLTPTVSGRMGSGRFDFTIDGRAGRRSVSVENAQIEIDAAYEGARFLSLFEAKCSRSHDFLIRQLYYPFRTWRERVRKPVKPVFFLFTGGVFYLYEYRFTDPLCYNSLTLVRCKTYMLDAGISRSDVEHLAHTVRTRPEPRVPFPQANSFERVINLLELLARQPLARGAVTGQYLFTERQTQYYTDAGRYLGLVKRTADPLGPVFALTERGERLMGLDLRQRRLGLAEAILEHGAFNEVFRLWLARGQAPDAGEVVHIMRRSRLYRVGSDSTYARRASSLLRWLGWIFSIVED